MKGFFGSDINNIIDKLIHRYYLCLLIREYRQVYWFVDTTFDYKCPNPREHCVVRYQNAKVHWLNGQIYRPLEKGPAVEWTNGDREYWCKK